MPVSSSCFGDSSDKSGSAGRNTASYPGYAFSYWLETLFPCQDDFDFEGATWTWPFRKALYKLRRRSKWIMLLASAAAASYYGQCS